MAPVRTHEEFQQRKMMDAFRQSIINDAVNGLMSEDDKRLKQMVADIIRDHVTLTKTDGFYFNGQVYTNLQGVAFKSIQKLPIHPSLKDRITEYAKQVIELKSDQAKISQGLAVLIRNCIDHQGVRNALPDLLIPTINNQSIQMLKRTLPEGHTLTSKLHIAQYEKTMDRVYFYLGSRLLG